MIINQESSILEKINYLVTAWKRVGNLKSPKDVILGKKQLEEIKYLRHSKQSIDESCFPEFLAMLELNTHESDEESLIWVGNFDIKIQGLK